MYPRLAPVQGIFSGRKIAEFEAAVVAGDHENLVLSVFHVPQRNPGAGKWMAFLGADDGAGDAEMADHKLLHRRLRGQHSRPSQKQARNPRRPGRPRPGGRAQLAWFLLGPARPCRALPGRAGEGTRPYVDSGWTIAVRRT